MIPSGSMSLQDFIIPTEQQSTEGLKSQMQQSLLIILSSKMFTKICNKQFAKVAVGISFFAAAVIILEKNPNIRVKQTVALGRHGLFGKGSIYVGMGLILYSFWFSIIGISVLANSLLKLPTPIRLETAASLRGYKDEDYEESKRKTKIITRMFGATIMMISLLWATCAGMKLTLSPLKERGLYALTISIGMATVVFGLIYFIIGAIIMVELAGGLVSPSPSTTKCDSGSIQGERLLHRLV
ncbi:hypothetical protein MLD38_013876 [Melastoma candidum]|uniref:Uncharacterized protein n=1 Tax=Melastoma candidum TaxID=119954 RepID=A0ACB9RC96_9MYRT|nr:hypothetical protein MLD38_013876 [Melastoma candidum]